MTAAGGSGYARGVRASAWSAIVAGVALAASPAMAGPSVEQLSQQAETAFQAGRFAEALVAFEALYALDPQPELLFAMGRCHQQLGDCARATDRFRAFLATGPEPAAREAAEARVAACAAAPPDVPPSDAADAPPLLQGVAVTSTTDRVARPGRGLIVGLAGAGFGVGAAAITLEVLGRRALDASADRGGAGDRAGRDAEYDRAQRLHIGAQIGGVIAVGCVAAAAVVWWRRPAARAAVALVPRGDGGAVVWSGGF